MPDCVFCQIVAGELPSTEVLSTPSTYAFRDIAPAMPVHVLVVPRRHVVDAGHLSAEDGALLADIFATAQAVARSEGLADRGYRLVFNVGQDSGNTVPHLHLHVLGGRQMGLAPV